MRVVISKANVKKPMSGEDSTRILELKGPHRELRGNEFIVLNAWIYYDILGFQEWGPFTPVDSFEEPQCLQSGVNLYRIAVQLTMTTTPLQN